MLNPIILIASILGLIVVTTLLVMFYRLQLKRDQIDHKEEPEVVSTKI